MVFLSLSAPQPPTKRVRRRSKHKWDLSRKPAPLATKIIWTRSCRRESTQKVETSGSVTFLLRPVPKWMLWTSRNSLTKGWEQDRRVKLAFALFAKSCMLSALMNSLGKLRLTALSVASCWFVCVMKSAWLFRLTKRSTKVQLPTECARLWWLNRRRMRWPAALRSLRIAVKNWPRRLRNSFRSRKMSFAALLKRWLVRQRLTKTRLTTLMPSITITSKSWRHCFQRPPSELLSELHTYV